MDDLKSRIKSLLHEIEYTHLKKDWVERLVNLGIAEEDAHKWVAEIGHVVDEYERSLRFLVDLLQGGDDVEEVAEQLDSWVAYTRDMTVWALDDVTKELEGKFDKYLSEDSDPE